MSRFRAWLPGQPEPEGFSSDCRSPYDAAAELIREDESLDTDDLQRAPREVLVRSRRTGEITRVMVTAETEVRIWGYRAELLEASR